MVSQPPVNRDLREGTSRRNQFEIWAGVLEACSRTGRTQSWLLRQLRLKTSAIKDAIEVLVTGGLVARSESTGAEGVLYETTPKGEEALVTYYKLVTKFFVKRP